MSPPYKVRPSLDDVTITAVEILHEAVMDAREGKSEFKVVSGALQRVIDNRQPADLAVAEAAFDRLSGDLRASIAASAKVRAEDQVRINGKLPPVGDGAPDLIASATARPPHRKPLGGSPLGAASPLGGSSGAPLIAAMNGRLLRKS